MFIVKEVSGNSECADEIFKIEDACFGAEAWSKETIKSTLGANNYIFFVCYENSKAIGYINASFVLDEAELNRVAVLKGYQGNGIAKSLVKALLEVLAKRNISLIRLEVRASNFPAIALYKSNNFQQFAVRKFYYNNPVEDAILMSLII